MIQNDVRRRDVVIEGDRIMLRTLLPDDASEEYARWLNDPVVNEYLETRSATVTDLRSYISERYESPTALFLGIFWKENGQHVGNVKLEPIDWEKRRACFGILVGDREYWGKGIGTDTTALLTDYAFAALGLGEVYLGVIPENQPAVRVYEKCGFSVDRIDKNALEYRGTRRDQLWMFKRSPLQS